MKNNWPETVDELVAECKKLVNRYDLFVLGERKGDEKWREGHPDGTDYLAGEYQYGVGMIPAQWVTHVFEDSGTCTLEINTSMTAVVCNKCNYHIPSGVNLLGVRYCPHCGAKVVNAWS